MSMHKVIIILPYFGNWPSYSNIFFESLKKNPKFDFLIFADKFPDNIKANNIKIINCTLNDLKKRFEAVLDTECSLEHAYKLCDYKPMYGLCFQDEIKNYDFWGYCDADMVFGDIGNFITNDILMNYEKVFSRGHLTLYKNTEKMINIFRTVTEDINWKNVVKNKKTVGFDEWKYIHKICEKNQVKTYLEEVIADIDCTSYVMKRTKGSAHFPQTFFYKDGKIFMHQYNKDPQEFLYIHLQKRQIINYVENINSKVIYFKPSEIVESDEIKSGYHEMVNLNKGNLKDIVKFSLNRNLKRLKTFLN